MKRMNICTIVLGMCTTLSAQLNKGQWLVGGSGTYATAKNSSDDVSVTVKTKQSTLQASPAAGYFFMDRLCAGIGLIVAHSNNTLDATVPDPFGGYQLSTKSTSTAIGVGPFVRYYFLPAVQKINLLAQLSYNYTKNNEKQYSLQVYQNGGGGQPQIQESRNSQKFSLNTYAVQAGPAFFLNPNVSLEVLVGYAYSKTAKSDTHVNSFTAGFGFQVHFGK